MIEQSWLWRSDHALMVKSKSLVIGPLEPIVGAATLVIGSQALVIGAVALVIGPWHRFANTSRWSGDFCHQIADIGYLAHRTGGLATRWDEVKPLYIFVKCFMKILKIKCFTTFTKDFTFNKKYFTSLATFYMQANT